MFAKLLMQKAMPQHNLQLGNITRADLNLQIPIHYGIPFTASIMAFDPIQCLLAIGTLDGRIKVLGGDNIEGLFMSPKKLPYKFLEFLCNQGFLVGVSNENDIQVWDLENRCLTCSLQWEFNVTAFSVIQGTYLMYCGDENGLMSVLKFYAEDGKILQLPYHIPVKAVREAAAISVSNHTSVVGILQQPCTYGNRVLIAYEDGVMVLWDISENCVVTVKGHTHLHLKGEKIANSPSRVNNEFQSTSVSEQEEKEICSLCWASTTGSILAVGYIDGDILLWNLSSDGHLKDGGVSSNNVAKLQLSSGGRRLPVIVLHWSSDSKLDDQHRGQLFVYGGDEIGSEEVLTVLSLDWSSGIETIKCVARVDLALHGSFADMILIPKTGAILNAPAAFVFVLTNPGQLHVYDISLLSDSRSREAKSSIQANKFPVVITADPCMTVTKLCLLPVEGESFKVLLKRASGKIMGETPAALMGMKWPLTGGLPCGLSFAKDLGIGRIYIAGYQDGSIRIWDATLPTFTLVHVIEGKVNGMELAGGMSSISALDFCSSTVSLAVGNECGLVCLYKLCQAGATDSQTFHFVTETKREVRTMGRENDFHCTAVFSVSSSAVRALQFAKSGDKLAVGFHCGQVTMLDALSISVLFHVDRLSVSSSPVISLDMRVVPHMSTPINSPKHSSPSSLSDLKDELLVLARNAHVIIVDSISGNIVNPRPVHPKKESTAIAMYVIDGSAVSEIAGKNHSQEGLVESESGQSNYPSGSSEQAVEPPSSNDALSSGEVSSDSVLLLCCEDALRLYLLKSLIQGDSTSIHKVNLSKPCCWSTIIKRKDEKACGLVLLYQTGVLEIRSLPNLEVVEESSLMSILRWSFKAGMDKTMSSSDNGHIALVNGSELAFISILASINDFRIPESLPSLHDKVLAAAADAAGSLSTFQKKKQGPPPGILGGLMKGFKGGKVEHSFNASECSSRYSFIQQMENYFSRTPYPEASTTLSHEQEMELSIDDINIDEDLPTASTSSHIDTHGRKEDMEREKLFQGAKTDIKPRLRTPEEIMTQYKFAGDASAAAAYARDKLALRQEKLEKIRERTEELRSGAEDFASMANELARTMEAKKWWKL
uniref:Syntaxin-binding protein 5 n=1 Tax=Anthurium amnicola TaxID=1678845 RepID=A0A1D1Z041_9ARAE